MFFVRGLRSRILAFLDNLCLHTDLGPVNFVAFFNVLSLNYYAMHMSECSLVFLISLLQVSTFSGVGLSNFLDEIPQDDLHSIAGIWCC